MQSTKPDATGLYDTRVQRLQIDVSSKKVEPRVWLVVFAAHLSHVDKKEHLVEARFIDMMEKDLFYIFLQPLHQANRINLTMNHRGI